MGHRGRSLRSDLEMTSAQNGGKSSSHLSTTVAGHPARHFRQFTTRSRTKSAASFRNLHRVLSHEGVTDNDSHSVAANSFTKSRSSDSLYRKRAISGLNMTMLARVRSNPGHIPRSRSGSMVSTHSLGGGAGSTRLKPSRSKGTQMVIDSHEADDFYDNDTTTDEEVEYFTDEEDVPAHKGGKTTVPNDAEPQDEYGSKSHSKSRDSMLLSKTFSNLTVPLEESENSESVDKQPSYQAPSNMIMDAREHPEEVCHNKGAELGGSSFHSGPQNDNAAQDQIDTDDVDVDKDGDDHISNSNLNVYDTETLSAHSLKRQGRDFHGMNEDVLTPGMNKDSHQAQDVRPEESNFEAQRRDSDIEQYMPSMILSQSTGAVRRFEQPPSIQNSLSNNFHNSIIEEGIRKGEEFGNTGDFSKSDDNEQRTEAATANQIQHYHANASQANHQHNFSTSISSLTNSLLKTAPESFHGNSRMSHLMRKRTSQNNLMRSDPRQGFANEIPSSPLHRDNSASVSSINNFAQFLKSDAMDGESRTQRKLWLQRENSIMDLSAHSDSNDPIFMASNVEVKREFERISHEYSNVRRFSNPVEEAIARVDSDQKSFGIKGSSKGNHDVVDSLFSNYDSRGKADPFLPKPHDDKLHRILSSIWKEETAQFNKDTNPLSRKANGTSQHFLQPNRGSLRGGTGSGTALQHQRTINSLQPTTRAVNRRIENAIHHQQRL